MATHGPRIEAYCYSEGPLGGQGLATATGPDANATVAVIESSSPATTTYARPLVPELFETQLSTLASSWSALPPQGAPAGLYSMTYDAATERVTIASTNSTIFQPVFLGNTARWFGFTQSIAGYATSWVAASPPAGLADILAVTVEPAEDAARVDLAEYRHGRLVATAWGNHQTHRVRLVFRSSTRPQIEAGYLTAGRVRIWQCGDATPYSPTNPDGYIDGYIIAAGDPTEDGDVGEFWTLRLLVGVAR